MAQLKDLINKRGNVKDIQIKEIGRRYADIKSILSEFESLHDEITSLRTIAEEREKDEEEFALFETLFYTVAAESDVFIDTFCKLEKTKAEEQPQAQTTANGLKRVNVGLPDIVLPKFKGNFDHWREFIDTFNALVHNNPAMSPVEKLHYLKACMVDDAASVINMLAATEENYNVAIEMLKKRFEHKRLTVNKHIANIYHFPKIVKGNAKEYRLLLDTINTSLLCLESLKIKTGDWDPLLIYIVAEKLDLRSRQEWEQKCDRDIPKWKEFIEYLGKRCEVLETFADSKRNANEIQTAPQMKSPAQRGQKGGQCSHVAINTTCPCCNNDHSLSDCRKFVKINNSARYTLLKKKRLCFKCFQVFNANHECTGQNCNKCGRGHHSMLHFDKTEKRTEMSNATTEVNTTSESMPGTQFGLHAVAADNQVLLSTAIVKVKTPTNDLIECRVLLDNGSQPNLITKVLFKKLGIQSTKADIRISGVNSAESRAYGKTNINIMSHNEDYNCDIDCYIVDNVTTNLPSMSFSSKGFRPPPGIVLADPTFNISRPIDMLLGANVFYDILSGGQVKLGRGLPILQKTKFGWIAGGGYVSNNLTPLLMTNHCTINENGDPDDNLNWQVSRFWEAESIETKESHLSVDEERCEDIFKATTKRNAEGRFVVKVPWKDNRYKLGKSLSTARYRFFSLEKKLQKNRRLQQAYIAFMKEYEDMGHMKRIEIIGESGDNSGYFIPHHAVVNALSTTTRVRVVFDARCKTDTDLSLNDVQLVGQTIQSDLFSLLLNFRKHNIVLTADVQKMYRQILIDEDDKRYHRIFWRADANDPLRCYELQTVTYGTASAPFLAVRCLFALADEIEVQHPKEAEIIKSNFYVDDLLTGADTIEEAKVIKEKIMQILQSAGLTLHKWASNHALLCPESTEERSIQIGDKTKRMLGTHWQVESDTIQYRLDLQLTPMPISKRNVLATTAKIFDPLGILGPIIVVAKIIFQSSWQENLAWDDPLPEQLQRKWLEFENQLEQLNSISIPRQAFQWNAVCVQLHGFCDASMKAYGACVYVRSMANGYWTNTLLCAKSKVAPLKSMTLPRLELQGAVLLANLVTKVQESIKVIDCETYLWCDSTIVLVQIATKSMENMCQIESVRFNSSPLRQGGTMYLRQTIPQT